MNIFGVGGAELVVILIIMLIVAGPKRMIEWAYVLGIYVGKLRRMWAEVVDVLQEEANQAGLDVKIPKELPTRKNIAKIVGEVAKPYTNELAQSLEKVKEPLAESVAAANAVVKETQVVKKPKAPGKAKQPAKSDLGSWSATPNEDEPEKPGNEMKLDFGAWSNPQQQSEESGEPVDR